MKKNIQDLSKQYFAEVVQIRRHLHQHPELSFQEVQTGRFIARQLEAYGIPYAHGMAGNGVVALIRGQNPDAKIVALRADIDALPIEEANEVPYKSQHPGVMHACGHDVHTASLLGTAKILHTLRDQLHGTLKLIFQPAEELYPGGASIMIREGVLENPKPTSIFGQHVHPPLEAGKVGFRPGVYMASADELYLTVRGRGGHGATPHNCIDPVVIAAQIITALQQIVSRYGDPTIPSVLTFGKINSTGGATNIIPDEVKLEGTFRTMDESWRFEAHRRMQAIAESIAAGMGGSCDFDIKVAYPTLYNDPALTMRARAWAEAYLGQEHVVELPIRMTAEDFAYYSQQMPACFYRLGTGNIAKGITSPVHTTTFDIDETALEIGMGLMAWLGVQELIE
ncbi:MAG TPA: M20 family metallopeptidase [Saprospiraceae bacterium]|nr:M20 family metallopeptidase [Saprospiraceae bacterium]HMP25469.1 M20 family metallopeptidase [Saprospiraceae bacterium]